LAAVTEDGAEAAADGAGEGEGKGEAVAAFVAVSVTASGAIGRSVCAKANVQNSSNIAASQRGDAGGCFTASS
jgi:hypothetical protein